MSVWPGGNITIRSNHISVHWGQDPLPPTTVPPPKYALASVRRGTCSGINVQEEHHASGAWHHCDSVAVQMYRCLNLFTYLPVGIICVKRNTKTPAALRNQSPLVVGVRTCRRPRVLIFPVSFSALLFDPFSPRRGFSKSDHQCSSCRNLRSNLVRCLK